MADHAGNAQAAMGNGAVAQVRPAWKSGSVTMARRATSLNAMFSAVRLGALATTTAWRTRSGVLQGPAQGSACHRDCLPITAANCCVCPAHPAARLGIPLCPPPSPPESPHPRPAGGRVGVVGPVEPSRSQCCSRRSRKPVGVQRLAGPDHVVPPALAAGDGLALRIRVHTSHMVRCVQA